MPNTSSQRTQAMRREQPWEMDFYPITRNMSGALQRTDPRCKKQGPVSAGDAVALAQLAEIVKAMSAAKAPKQKAGSGT
jgi:hypothetical protein